MSSRATMALNAGITDFAATSQGMINKRPLKKQLWNLFKHDLRHNLSDRQSYSGRRSSLSDGIMILGLAMKYVENRSGCAFCFKEAINRNGNCCNGETHGYGRS